jgi:hypothetical protein
MFVRNYELAGRRCPAMASGRPTDIVNDINEVFVSLLSVPIGTD